MLNKSAIHNSGRLYLSKLRKITGCSIVTAGHRLGFETIIQIVIKGRR